MHQIVAGIATDETTGKPCLKIPMPEPEALSTLITGLGQLLAGFLGGEEAGNPEDRSCDAFELHVFAAPFKQFNHAA